MTVEQAFIALALAGLLLISGVFIRRHVTVLQRLYLPSSIVAGTVALLAGPEVLGRLVSQVAPESTLARGLFPDYVREVWSALPSLLITVVFACLFVGKRIPPLAVIWQRAGPMITHGQALAWGQYVVGITLVIVLLGPVFGMPAMTGALIEIGFEGGHGTAAGLAETFRELGFANGADLAIGLATVGVVSGVLLGTVLVNWGARSGRIDPEAAGTDPEAAGEEDPDASEGDRVRPGAAEPLAIHFGYLALAIAAGWLILQALVWVESVTWGRGEDGLELLVHVPLFPLAMIGGVLFQLAMMRAGRAEAIDRDLVNRISAASLDILIVAALATLSLEALGTYFWPLVILAVAGIAWNVFGFLVLAPRMIPDHWFEKGLANFGQGIGMTVIGLLLVRMSDPRNRTGAMEGFGYKQLLFEPVVGGGVFTAASLPLLYAFGAVPVLVGTASVMVGWLLFGWWAFGRGRD